MTKEEINEGNKIIHEWMGFNKIPSRHYNEMNPALQYYGNMDRFGTVNNLLSENELKYHTSWDWLMPVVEKIQKMKINYHPVQVRITEWCEISIVVDNGARSKVVGLGTNYKNDNTLIDCTYIAVVKFIKWHNSQPHP